MKRITLIIILTIGLIAVLFNALLLALPADNQTCSPQPPEDANRAPGNDHGDDLSSYSDAVIKEYNLAPEAVIYTNGYYQEALKLYGGLKFDGNNTAEELIKITPFLVIPSGGLFGKENDFIFKEFLKQYVKLGGTIVVFAQQQGFHFDEILPIPEGEKMKSVGFRSDQSCYSGSAYYDQIHPVTSSWATWYNTGSMGTDGYFIDYPSNSTNSTVILRRTKNKYPLMLYYPYTNEDGTITGGVIVASLFTDWAAAHGQSTLLERRLVRDLITFAKNTRKEIPLYSFENTSSIQVELQEVNIKNNSEIPAAKVKLMVLTPDRDKVLYETERSTGLDPAQETIISLAFVVNNYSFQSGYGICYLDYILYDNENNIVQMAAESDGGRFAVYQKEQAHIPTGGYDIWITSLEEQYYINEKAQITLHVKSYKEEPLTIYWWHQWGHTGGESLPTLVMGPGEEKEYYLEVDFPQYMANYKELQAFFHLRYKSDPNSYYKILQKGFLVKGIQTESRLNFNSPRQLTPGGTFNYSIQSKYVSTPLQGNTTIELALEKFSRESNQYEEIKILKEEAHDFNANGDFQFAGTYTPETVHPYGRYRIKLAVTAPNGIKEQERYQEFIYDRSGFLVNLAKMPQSRLIPGESYTLPIKITNFGSTNNYTVKNGTYVLVLRSENNHEVFRKEITGITIAAGEEQNHQETFVFNPVQTGQYTLEYNYTDETGGDDVYHRESQTFFYITSVGISADKAVYEYLDNANIGVTINGVGSYTVQLNCPEAGFSETRQVVIPIGSSRTIEQFQFPIGVYSIYTVNVEVKDVSNRSFYNIARLSVNPIELDCAGQFKDNIARAGKILEFEVNMKRISGFSQPLTGELAVTSSQLNYQDIKTVALQPLGDNRFLYTIPVDSEAPVGFYGVDVQLNSNGVNLLSKQYKIYLPEAKLEFSLPGPGTYNAGDTFTLTMENTGGKPGNFDIDIRVKDSLGKIVLEHRETRSFEAGDSSSLNITLPVELKSDRYILVQQAANIATQHQGTSFTPLTVTGIFAGLNSFTLKHSYFDNEPVSGKSEMDPGSGGIENGVLQAKIIHYAESKGFEEEEPGEFIPYNMIENGYSSGNMLYLVTDKGVLRYDVVSGSSEVLYSFNSNPGFNCNNLFLSTAGELWIASTYGIWRQNSSGQWEQYTTADGLANDYIYDIIEVNGTSGSETWAATYGGISVFRNGQWVNYTTANGLPSNRVDKIALDGSGAVWASTSGGVVKYNGISFESVNAPFGNTNISGAMTSTVDGSIWLVASSKLYRYQPASDQWNQWNIDDLCPTTYSSPFILDIGTVNGQLWMRARDWDTEDNQINGLIVYNGSFISYTNQEIPGLFGLNPRPIIPGSAAEDSAYFACEVGFMAFDSSAWQHRVLEIDSHKLPGTIYSLVKDKNGNLWAGTEYGLSMYNVYTLQWTNYCSTPGNELLLDILQVDTDGQNSVYGYTPYLDPWGGIIKIDIDNGNIETIPFPWYGFQHGTNDDRMAIDTLGRIWFGYMHLYYYGEGEWHEGPDVNLIRCMIKDFNGGVWLGAEFYLGDYSQFHLLHIKNDFTIDEYNASNSELIPWEKDRLYLDQNGILWIKHDYYNEISLQSFDGSNWIDYSNYEGFPQYKLMNMVKDDRGTLWVLDREGHLYSFENNQFIIRQDGIFYSDNLLFSNGKLYSAGSRYGYYFYPTNFLKISSAEGLIEEELWSQNYIVNLASGGTEQLDLLTGKTFPPGAYELKTALFSPLQQELAASDYGFVVKDAGLSISLFADCSPCGFLKPNTDLGVTVEVFNNTPETKSNLNFTVKKISPDGTEEGVLSNTLTLAPAQLETLSFTFNESTTGTWKLAASLSDPDTGEEKESNLFVGVTETMVFMEVLAPEYSGDENFDIKLRLINEGNINAQLNVQVSAGSETPIDETLTLQPREERILTIDDAISADKTYTIALSGDIEQTETKTVKYGYVENFSIDIQSAYREGPVFIGYTLANSGGLSFTDQVHFELFTVGGTLPIYTVERNYQLYPDQAPIMDTIDIPLLPGNYQLQYHTSKHPQVQTALLAVQPSGIGSIAVNSSNQYPVGAADINFSITNTDTFVGQVPITLTLFGSEPGVPLLTETRSYYLLAGETQNDVLHYEFTTAGNYTLNFTGAKLPTPVNSIIRVMNLEQVTANLSIGQVETGSIPVNVNLDNSGYQSFTGTVVIEVEGLRHEEIMEVSPGSSFEGAVGLNTSVLTPGSKEVKVFLYDNAGNTIAQTTETAIVQPANIKLVEFPTNLEISAGSFGEVTLTLKNQGNLRGEATLTINTFDNLYQEREIVLEPGAEVQLGDIIIDIPTDLPSGIYPFYYTLKGSGVETGTSAGNFYFKVNGLSLDIDASLDRPLYNPGETAALTLNITGDTAADAPLEAVVNWGIFSETRSFNLSSGSTSLVFDIPLDEAREEKVFYGIYHEGGKGIHLNDIYLNFRGEISVETDKQVYAPGEIVHAVFTGEHTGVLTVSSFAESYTLDFSSTASASFQVPIDTLGGTYGISWSLTPSDPEKPELSGSQPFDVSGLVVKVAKSVLEKGKYEPGEAINAHYIFESNQDQTLKLRNWVIPPSGDWTYLGESSVTVSSQQQVDAMTGYSFNTTEAGTHELVYGLYLTEACETCDQLVVSGRLSFDVGNAVLLGISTDQWEYKNGNEPVTLKIDHFGEGFSQLQVHMDEENVHQQGISLSGTGSTEVVLQSSSISGGSHIIKAVLIQNNLTSTKTTGFTYGTHLPDLTAWLTDTIQDGLNYSFKIQVTNAGKTASAASSLLFSDNDTNVGTASIPALELEQFHEVTFNWNGTGKAGSHELMFAADNTNTVKEFSETNNNVEFTLEVPALFYSLETDPPEKLIYPANTPINFITRLINNQETPALLTLDLSITNDESGVIIHTSTKEEEIPAFANKTITDTFNTEVYPAGNYTARGALFEKTVPLNRQGLPAPPLQKLLNNMVRELFLYFEPTKIVTGTLQVQPQQIPAKTPTEVQLTMTLKNAGNVPLEDEILHIDVFNKDLGEVVISEELLVSIPLAEEITETKTMSLNLVEGNYEIWLKHNEEILALADLSAISAVKPNQTIGIYPRVLIMILHQLGVQQQPMQFLTGLLQSQGIDYEIGVRLLDSYVKLNKGQANVNIVLGNEMGGNLRDELKEKVFHGEGLILFCDKPAQNPEWIDFLGVTIKPIPGKTRETVVQILPNEFCSEGEIECAEELKLQMIKEKEDVVIIAQTKQKQYPVMAYRKYGKGHILMIAVPLEFKSGIEHMSQLLLNTIATFSLDIYTGSDLTRLLPLELSLKNESSEAAALKIKTFLPYGVEAFDFKPEPEEGEELEWTITVPAVSTETISYWLKLPDQVNSFEIKTELYEEETKLDEVSTTFEVIQTVLFRINELILELDMTGAVGKDAQLIRKAKHHLEQVRNRTGNSFMEHLLNLIDSVKAAAYLGEVKSVDVSSQRLKTQDIMVIMGRRFYEAVKAWGEVQLSPILEFL
jgi:ligand-binding sensor domain-containing protein